MRTNHETTRAIAIRELSAILGRKPAAGGQSMESLFESAVDCLLSSGQTAKAELTYSRFAAVCEHNIREESATAENQAYREALAEAYSDYEPAPAKIARELLSSASSWEPILRRAKVYRPLRGPALAPTSIIDVCGPSAKQTKARAGFASKWARRGKRATTPASAAELAAVAALVQ